MEQTHEYKYLLYIGIALSTVLIIANTAATKLIQLGSFAFPGTIILFPLTYIFGDILTEVYGYHTSRKVIWSCFAALIFTAFVYTIIVQLPPAPFWNNQDAFASVLGNTPRIVFASLMAYFFAEFTNSYILSRMKIWTHGKHLWSRTIGSTIGGEAVDSVIFFTIAFYAVVPSAILFTLIWSNYVFKVIYEVVATPFTYRAIAWLKKEEGIDTYDHGVNYNPFAIRK